LPIPPKALKYLPERGKYNEAVFKIPDRSYCNKLLKFWAASAGIHKNLHWHVSRHSFATMLLSKEVPLTSVSEFLQHSELRTTQTYAKVINQALIDAAKKMDSYFE
jgi:site-specific recombinase XerD